MALGSGLNGMKVRLLYKEELACKTFSKASEKKKTFPYFSLCARFWHVCGFLYYLITSKNV